MRLFVWIVLVVGFPFVVWDQLTSGHPDLGLLGLSVLLFVLAVAALYYNWQRGQAKRNQQRFWANHK